MINTRPIICSIMYINTQIKAEFCMKKIGFVDYYIDEWHANNYIKWFENASKELGLDYTVEYAWAYLPEKEGLLSTTEWCRKNGITECATVEELCRKSENILILAPSDPQVHLMLAEKVLPFGKTTYIDKTFAESAENAGAIYALADKYNTQIFSASALRYGDELCDFAGKEAESVSVTGSGDSLEEYCIHQLEMIVKLMGIGAKSVNVYSKGIQSMVHIAYENGRMATLSFCKSAKPFSVDVAVKGAGTGDYREIKSDFFYNLIKEILRFFESNTPPFNRAETLEVIALRDSIIKGLSLPAGTKIEV